MLPKVTMDTPLEIVGFWETLVKMMVNNDQRHCFEVYIATGKTEMPNNLQ